MLDAAVRDHPILALVGYEEERHPLEQTLGRPRLTGHT